jgi:TfoX/Sxy family transcriptional regulator of competence genes
MGRTASNKPLKGFTAEESALIRAYRKEKMREYWSKKSEAERKEIHRRNELRAAIKAAERRKAQEEAAGLACDPV